LKGNIAKLENALATHASNLTERQQQVMKALIQRLGGAPAGNGYAASNYCQNAQKITSRAGLGLRPKFSVKSFSTREAVQYYRNATRLIIKDLCRVLINLCC
jgi:hypothetical protein